MPSDIHLHNTKYTISCFTWTFLNRLSKALAWDNIADQQNFKIGYRVPTSICLNHEKKKGYSMGDLHLANKFEQKINLIICNWSTKLCKDIFCHMYKQQFLENFFLEEIWLARMQQLLNIYLSDEN